MEYISIAGAEYPASISGRLNDAGWDGRESKAITLRMDYATASGLFINNAAWSIISEWEEASEDGQSVAMRREVYDNSDFCVAGAITDNRDGTITVKMGKMTALEQAYEMLFGGEA